MEYITDTIINSVLDEMPDDFDTHAFIERLTRLYPSDYTKELCRYKDYDDPFLVLHPLIGKALASNGRVQKMGKVDSPNIGGRSTSNEAWRKVN